MRAFVGLGSNLGDREGTIARAVELLSAAAGVELVAVSRLRETEPWGPVEQPAYLNGAIELETELPSEIAIERLTLQHEGWERDTAVPEPPEP